MFNKHYDTLCMSGGGTRFLSVLGALTEIENKKIFDISKIQKYICCSAGSLLSLILSIGYTPKEIIEFMLNFNLFILEPDIDCDFLFTKLGLDDGKKLIFILKKFIKVKFNVDDLTFLQHYEKTKKTLIVAVTNYTKKCNEYFDYKTAPDLSVADAVRISCSVPGYFTPYLYNDCYYIDGGVLDNFPIQLCDVNTSIGIFLKIIDNNNELPELLPYMYNVINMIIGSNVQYKMKIYNMDIIKINLNKGGLLNFSMSYEEKKDIIYSGRECVIEYYNNLVKSEIKSILDEIINSIKY